ncbi:hypothetical protein HPB47_001968 [Ixodes persulcatus]|uniref:Uncharacterized protein n=1 Tax=Ixodes persulcatus TaxID=34615 RepID=A0AC60PMN7_IXOPE|nr:hypothetical protein HPB47_001968 [Ixodes persulcatus]
MRGSFTDETKEQQFLDLGCGTGDFTRDHLLPLWPEVGRIVGVDVSRDMVEHAKRKFAHPKICYDVLDIGGNGVADFVGRYALDLPDRDARLSYISGLLKNANLIPTTCEVLEVDRRWSSVEQYTRAHMGITRLANLVTEEEKPLLLKDVAEEGAKLLAEEKAGGSPFRNSQFLVRAHKPRQ